MRLDNQESKQIPEGAETPTSNLVSTEPQPSFEDEVSLFENEVSLVDLWIVLVKRKVLIGAVVATTLLSGVVFFVFPWTKPQQQYEFSTTIEIGQIPNEIGQIPNPGQGTLIDSPDTVIAKLKEAYIPLSRQEFAAEGLSAPAVQAKAHGVLVVLKTVGSSQNTASHLEFLEAITQRLLSDHFRVIEAYRTGVGAELERAKSLRLEELEIPRILAVREKEPETQISSQAGATLEMLRLDWAIEQADQEQIINRIEARLRVLKETRVVLPPLQFLVAAASTPSLVRTLSIAGILGLVLGIFWAFGAEFRAYAKKEMSERGLLQN